jgi:hypothetical protein
MNKSPTYNWVFSRLSIPHTTGAINKAEQLNLKTRLLKQADCVEYQALNGYEHYANPNLAAVLRNQSAPQVGWHFLLSILEAPLLP